MLNIHKHLTGLLINSKELCILNGNDDQFDNLIFIFYIIFIIILYLTDNQSHAYSYFVYFLGPLAFLPVKFVSVGIWNFKIPLPLRISFLNPLKTFSMINSYSFFLSSLYLFMICLSSSIYPHFESGWLFIFLSFLLSSLVFMLITARLFVYIDNFLYKFIILSSLPCAASAALNLMFFFKELSSIDLLFNYSFMPTFGIVPDHWSTTGAHTYMLFFVSACCTIPKINKRILRFFMILSIILVFMCVVLSQSRGALLAIIIVFFIELILNNSISAKAYVNSIAIFMFTGFLLKKILISALFRGDTSRFEIWSAYLDLAIERPVFGYGERLAVIYETKNGAYVGHAHNLFIAAQLRGGFFALYALIFVFYNCMKYSYYYMMITKNPIPFYLTICIFVSGLFDFEWLLMISDWQWVSFLLPVALCMGCELYIKSLNHHLASEKSIN